LEWWLIVLILFGGLIVLLASGMPVAFCFLLVNLVGVVWFWGGEVGLRQLILSMDESVTTFVLLPVPLFIFMGEVLFHSGMGLHAIDVLDRWMGRMPGRLALLAVGSGTLFSTISGSSMATTAMLGTILVPEMEKRGYKKPMSLGPVMGGGGLAMIIPPTALGVLLASLARISVGKLLISGIIPGLILAFFYAAYIITRCWLQPSIAPSYKVTPTPLAKKAVLTMRYVLPLGVLIFLVIGVIFVGLATPSEAAALGALGSIFLAAVYRGLNWEVLKKSVLGAIRITVMMFMIMTGATAFSQILGFSGASRGLLGAVAGFPITPILLVISMQVIVLFMGCFMEQASMLMITLPIYMPVIHLLAYDPVWFGILLLINMEVGMTSPPFGLSLFVMKGVAPPDTTMGDIYRAVLPFIGFHLVVMALIMAFPILALWLPGMM